jgi:hypothetical protein
MDSSHQVEFVALEGVKIIGNMLSEHLHVCKISLELWNPALEAEIPSPILAKGSEVVISHVCSSNFCYVKLSHSPEHHRLLLDINYLLQNSGMTSEFFQTRKSGIWNIFSPLHQAASNWTTSACTK